MELKTLSSPCKIYRAVESVTGLPASSASLTDIYVLHCKPRVVFDGRPVSHIFAKLCVSVDSLTPAILERLQPYLIEQKEGVSKQELLFKRLLYAQAEYNAYEIVKQIYYSYMCPFFPRVYGVGMRCTYKHMYKLLGPVGHNFKRNIFYSLTDNTRRPAIHVNEDSKQADVLYDPENHLRFNVLLLQYMSSPSFYELLQRSHYTEVPQLLNMLFMVGFACYALHLNRLCHRDLHLRNVLVEPCESRLIVLIVDSKAYEMEITEFPRVFDFDRSKERPCAQDLFQFVSYMAQALPVPLLQLLASCFLKPDTNPFSNRKDRLVRYWQQPFETRSTDSTRNFIVQLNTLPNVLHALAEAAGINTVPAISPSAHVFIARPDMVGLPNVREAYFSVNRAVME
jgi:hypothetical protein